MTPTDKMLINFGLAGLAGGFLGYKLSKKKSRTEGAALGATVIMLLYGVVKERPTSA